MPLLLFRRADPHAAAHEDNRANIPFIAGDKNASVSILIILHIILIFVGLKYPFLIPSLIFLKN